MTQVREALAQYRKDNGVDEDSYQDPKFVVPLGPLRLRFPNPGKLHLHDLHHVATGYHTDLIGEIEISAFEWRAGSLTPLIALLCLGSFALGLIVAPRRLWRAWRHARGCQSLYDLDQPYESLLELDVAELRALLAIPKEGWAKKTSKR